MPTYALPELPYSPGALEPHYSGEIISLHHDKHHAAYVKGANDTLDALAAAREAGDFGNINQLSRSFAFHVSGHVLHSIFWTNMSPDGGGRPEGELATAIDEFFGGFDALQAQLTAATVNVQGIGWGALAWEPVAGKLIVEQIYDHQGNVGAGSVPLLVIDAWEHAYYLQYKNVRADFVKAFWNIVNWPNVAERFAAARTVPATI
ncbi:MAG: superoxide dismutase [Actinobacteria bacterium]|jgi:Fe-Mn family superoxide dismutase|nr:superoxide dismutase [Acidimicrobiaceae bacterium]MBP6486551.1 superoxide dismutase [Ilumatobacteraceae bacterium]NMD25336.1 superoxide dismutase [Actinomycetota bacterium]MBK9971761.1 superoxide dismutase [Acidimicrobiaceae bacterium]MBP7888342.1 superoxide dismutase [Ilumatobacteraceae bacterium]